jgi:hypothetical protein
VKKGLLTQTNENENSSLSEKASISIANQHRRLPLGLRKNIIIYFGGFEDQST